MSKLKVFYVEYTSKHRKQIPDFLLPLLKRLYPSLTPEITIVDTSGACNPTDLPQTTVNAGDNSSREFSGWQTAIDRASIADDDVICLCNDTFARNYGFEFLSWFQRDEVVSALGSGKVVGYADSRRGDSQIFGLPVKRWIRTSIVFISGGDLVKLLPLTLPVSDSAIFAQSGMSLFQASAPIDAATKQWLDGWLVNGSFVSGESTERWYLSAHLTDQNREFMHLKAKSILCELFFAAKIRQQGLEIFDVRRSRARKFGALYLLDRLGILDRIQDFRRNF